MYDIANEEAAFDSRFEYFEDEIAELKSKLVAKRQEVMQLNDEIYKNLCNRFDSVKVSNFNELEILKDEINFYCDFDCIAKLNYIGNRHNMVSVT